MNEPKRVSLWVLLLLALFASVIVFDIAYGDDELFQSNDMNSNNLAQTAGDLSITGTRSYGYSGPDVDIAQCYRSWSFIIQGSQPNLWCFADSLDAKGLHEAAAITRCKIKGYGKLFESESACLKLSLMKPVFHVEPMPEPVDNDEDNERIEALYSLVSNLQAQRTQEAEMATKAAQRANLAAQRVNKAESERKERAELAYLDYQEQFIEQD